MKKRRVQKAATLRQYLSNSAALYEENEKAALSSLGEALKLVQGELSPADEAVLLRHYKRKEGELAKAKADLYLLLMEKLEVYFDAPKPQVRLKKSQGLFRGGIPPVKSKLSQGVLISLKKAHLLIKLRLFLLKGIK